MTDITYPHEMLPSPTEGEEADVIVDGKIIYRKIIYRKDSKMDWADKIAASLVEENSSEGYDGCLVFYHSAYESEIAAALRNAELRGRANGMREAAKMLDGDGKWNCGPSCLADDLAVGWAKAIRSAASKLQPT